MSISNYKLCPLIDLEEKYDLTLPDIFVIKNKFKESFKPLQEENERTKFGKQVYLDFVDKILNKGFTWNDQEQFFKVVVDGIVFRIYPRSNINTIGYDPETRAICIFIDNFHEIFVSDLKNKIVHEVCHYLDGKDSSINDLLKHSMSNFTSWYEYYNDPLEYEAHKQAFLVAAEDLFEKNLEKSYTDIDTRQIPKVILDKFFELVKTGKLKVYYNFINNLSDEHLKDLYNSLLHYFAESFESIEGRLSLKEARLCFSKYFDEILDKWSFKKCE